MAKDSNSMLNEMGIRIRECRTNMHLTQEELAEKADISLGVLYSAESGRKSIKVENLLKLSLALGVSTDYLLKGDLSNADLDNLLVKLNQMPHSQIENIEKIINICVEMYNSKD